MIKVDVRPSERDSSFGSERIRDFRPDYRLPAAVSPKARVETSTTDTEDVTLRGPPRLPRPSPCRGGDDPSGGLAVSITCIPSFCCIST